jgi:tetrahydromethanopterin S-methyltransferase subunit B
MSMIHVSPEAHLVMDPMIGLIAKEREDIISYSMDPVLDQIAILDNVADDLMNSLTPDKELLNSFPGRARTSYMAGVYSNAFYGLIIGLAFAGLLTVLLYVLSLMRGGM